MAELKNQIQTSFKLSGLTVRLEGCRYLAGLLGPVQQEDRQAWIDKILEHLLATNLTTNVVDKELLAGAVRECSDQQAGRASIETLTVISAFQTPRLSYSVERKKYLTDSVTGRGQAELLSGPSSRAQLHLDRYTLLHQRTGRHDLFSGPGGQSGGRRYRLQAVEFLLGTTARLDDVIVLGMICQLSHGTWHLEDPSGVVQLDLTETKFHTGLYTEACFVLAEGWYEDSVFHVLALGFPPAEPSATTRAYFGNLNFFGGPGEGSAASSAALVELEQRNPDAMLVFVSDVWLDQATVISRLRSLFAGYSAMPPAAFVLCGNFLSCVGEPGYVGRLRGEFRHLADLISEFPPLVAESKFLFVPGPADPGSPNIFPRAALPPHITAELASKLPGARFLTNPARVQFCTQEIVIFREDIVTKLCRNAIHFPESGEISAHFAKTITAQAHLAPLPLHTCPVYWDHDRALSLYPLPDLIITADKFEPFTAENLGCKVVNPGSFAKHDFSFKTYIPSSRSVEDSQVPSED